MIGEDFAIYHIIPFREDFCSIIDMLNNINNYVKRHNNVPTIICCDDPRRLHIGFECKDSKRSWYVPLLCIRRDRCKRMYTKEGREELCKKFGKQKCFRRNNANL
jgi:hypothetical protein